MQSDQPHQDRRYYSHLYAKRTRGPRFGLIILMIMAIISVVIALTVAYILT